MWDTVNDIYEMIYGQSSLADFFLAINSDNANANLSSRI